MQRHDRPMRARMDSESHPVAWFNALVRGAERGDTALIDKARAKLEQLGFAVIVVEPRQATHEDRRDDAGREVGHED
jgi:hypothetical protein